MALKYKGFVAWQKLSHLTRPLGRPCQRPVLLALPATCPPDHVPCHLDQALSVISTKRICRFLDFALRAALEMTREGLAWMNRFLDCALRASLEMTKEVLRSKSQEAQSLEMSRAMLSGPMLFQSILFFYFSLSFCSAIVSSTICCNWYVATPNGLLIPLSDHSTMVLLWARHISSPMLGLSSSPLRSSSAALT